MKLHNCDACHKEIEVYDEYEPVICCSGLSEQCGCMGLPINPIFCDECAVKFCGQKLESKEDEMKPFD
jgi:hypothetical protein